MIKKLKIISFLAFTIIFLSVKAEDPLEKLLKKIAKLTTTYPQEKIHIHTDKPYYAIGETVWLKGYVVIAEKNEPSTLSGTMHVELIDAKNKVKKKISLPVNAGLASGNINLVDSLPSGLYRLRAYTNYMRNFDERFFFEKTLTIGNVAEAKKPEIIKTTNFDFSLQFFPEGGKLLTNIRTKVGIKATSSNGMGTNLSGYILDSKKEKVAVFTTEYAGMGAFAFTPQQNENYTAVVTLQTGQTKNFDVPQATLSGRNIAINTTNESINVRVSNTTDLIDSKELYIVAQCNGVVYSSFIIKAENANTTASIPIKTFPTGIIQFTLLDPNLTPIAERLVFVNHQDALKIDIKNLSPNATTRRKTELSFSINDSNENPIDGNFSVSVTDLNKAPIIEDEETTIISNLLLTADLKGYIERPNYYFNNINIDKVRQLDNLMLTQGWRRFVWKDIIEEKLPVISFKAEKNLSLSGIVTFENSDKPVTNAKIILLSTSKDYTFILDTVADINGRFAFDKLELPDSITFVLQAKTANENDNVKIKLDGSPKVFPTTINSYSLDFDTYLEETRKRFTELKKYNMLDGAIQLKQVYIHAKKSPIPVNKIRNSKNLAGQADYIITKEKFRYETALTQSLLSVPGIMFYDGKFVRTSARTVSVTSEKPKPMLFFLDGAVISQDKILNIPPSTVEGIEVLTSNYNLTIYGEQGYWGVVLITTKMYEPNEELSALNKLKVTNYGFGPTKEFYVPNYDDPKVNKQMEDLRSTIYWNSNVSSDIRGKANVSFFNAGTPGLYNVVIEGMDNFGNLGRKVYTYEVK